MASGLVIAEIYAAGSQKGGAQTGVPAYKFDYVVLHNLTGTEISLSDYAIQSVSGSSAAGTAWGALALSGTVPAYGFYLIQLGVTPSELGGADLPVTPDAIAPDALAVGPNSGKIALTNSTAALTANVSSGPTIVDMAGYGSNANAREGGSTSAFNAPSPNNAQSIHRDAGAGWDTNSNVSDFAVGTPTPRNTGSAADDTGAPAITSPATVALDENTASVLAVTATDAEGNTPLSYSILTGTAAGADGALFAVDSTGHLSFLSAPDFETPDQSGTTANQYAVTIRVADSGGSSRDQLITVTVNDANEAPTAIGLSNTSFAENNAANFFVGSLTATDPDTSPGLASPFTYESVVGEGDTDNALFAFGGGAGDELLFTGAADYETKTSYSIRLQVTDAAGGTFQAVKTINVTDLNTEYSVTAPTDSDGAAANAIDENKTGYTGLTASASDADLTDTVSYALVTDLTGTTAYTGPFSINAASGAVNLDAGLDFETAGALQDVFVKATSTDGSSQVTKFTVTLNNTAETPPTAMALSRSTVNEFAANGTVVGALSTTDDGSQFTYALLDGSAGGRFAISGADLVVADALLLDFEQAGSHDVTVRVTDADNLTFDKTFTISLTDVTPESITGDARDNVFLGGNGNDFFDGAGGADTLSGGAGNDTYVTDGSDSIIDIGGIDTVWSSVSFALALGLENLALTGGLATTGTGNSAANVINGGSDTASNVLAGLAGNDSYIVGSGDRISEITGGGTDTVFSSTVSLNLASLTMANVERASLTGSASLKLIGSTAANVLTGNIANNVIAGGFGNDILHGGAGKDTFVFNAALSATGNRDVINDYSSVADTIQLENAIFRGLGTATGLLGSAKFWASATGIAHDADDRILYNKTTGLLSYDADGSGAAKAIAFAVLSNKPALSITDFIII